MGNALIKFGTSGWRAILAEDFTHHNVRRAVTGIARYVVSKKPTGARVIVGRDPRYMGETFVQIAAEVLSAHGVTPLVVPDAAPTPAISFAITALKADGAINFTASHNPAEYNGLKFNSSDGAPSLPDVTKAIEAEVMKADAEGLPAAAAKLATEQIDITPAYLKRLKEIVDLSAIAKSG